MIAPSAQQAISTVLAPRSVAVIGASADPEKLSSKPLTNLVQLGFQGPVYPVNPRAERLEGLPCYPSVGALPETPDLAFLVLPAKLSVAAAWECARRGVTAAIVAVSGFGEAGTDEGAALDAELRQIVRETGMRIVGPNCNGVYNARRGISLGYNGAHAQAIPPGPFSLVSHSGALFSVFADRAREVGLGFGSFVSCGNETDLNMLDFLTAAIEDPECRVIGLVVEALRDGTRFRELIQQARSLGKQVVALKLGTSELGHATTQAHSSRLAGSARAYAALFRQAGAIQVTTPEALVATARLLADGRCTGGGLGALTTTGAGGALLADAAARHGLRLSGLGERTRAELDQYRKFAPILNPIDLGATGTECSEAVARALAADPDVAALVLYTHLLLRTQSRANVASGLAAAHLESGKPTIVLAPGGLQPDEAERYREAGVVVLNETEVCFEALAALVRESGRVEPSADPADITPPTLSSDVRVLLARPGPLDELESGQVLAAFGVPVVESALATDEGTCVAAASRLGWPVVLKGLSREAGHKSDLGLVALGVADEAQARETYRSLRARAEEAGVDLAGVLVQPQLRGRLEVILGLTREPAIGTLLLAGLGGIYAEALDATTSWIVPVSAAELRAGLRESPLGRVLLSPRWPDPNSLEQVVQALLSLQVLACHPDARVAAVDVNPLLLGGESGAVAVDALVITAADSLGER